jgi:hypothetical protein
MASTIMPTNTCESVPEPGPEQVELFPCHGNVTSIPDFLKANRDKFRIDEWKIIEGYLPTFPHMEEIPEPFHQCLTRTHELAKSSTPRLTVRRSGARSAFDPKTKLQLKGCRPALHDETFPVDVLQLEGFQITRDRIPFGAMTDKAVLWEILGYCFMRRVEIPVQATPLAVTCYSRQEHQPLYSVLLKLQSEDRLESHLDIPSCTVKHIIEAQLSPSPNQDEPVVGSEVRVLGLNLLRCMESNARLLAKMHWHGGFRGILNSNFGNTVLIPDDRGSHTIALADFDTFAIHRVPQNDSPEQLDPFVLQCLLEVVMGSLPILQYVHLPYDCSLDQKADALGAVYFSKSSLWRSYYRNFLANATDHGITIPAIVKSIERMRRTSAFVEVLESRVLTGESIAQTELRKQYCYAHN